MASQHLLSSGYAMRNNLVLSALALVLCCIAGCVRIPQPQGYPYSDQKKMQAAQHWNVLANDVANKINNELIRRNYLSASLFVKHSCNKPEACKQSETFPFDEGFNDLLTTQLVNFGVNTQVVPDGATLTVDYKVQVVYHQSDRTQWPQPGLLTALTTGVMVFRDAPWEIIAIASAAAIDTVSATTTVNGHYEVIITTSIIDGTKYVMRSSDIYYINDADFWQYQQASPAAEVPLTGKDRVIKPAESGASKP